MQDAYIVLTLRIENVDICKSLGLDWHLEYIGEYKMRKSSVQNKD